MNTKYKLNNKVFIYGMVDVKDQLGDNTRKEGLIKFAFSKIIPLGNKTVKTRDIATEYNEHKFKFIFRYLTVKNIQEDWYFLIDDLKYKVDYWNPDFANHEYIEVFTTLIR